MKQEKDIFDHIKAHPVYAKIAASGLAGLASIVGCNSGDSIAEVITDTVKAYHAQCSEDVKPMNAQYSGDTLIVQSQDGHFTTLEARTGTVVGEPFMYFTNPEREHEPVDAVINLPLPIGCEMSRVYEATFLGDKSLTLSYGSRNDSSTVVLTQPEDNMYIDTVSTLPRTKTRPHK